MKRVIVCGGRDYANALTVMRVLDRIAAQGEFFLIQGGATGADRLALEWAVKHTNPHATVPAHWDSLGKRAGPVRNTWMLALQPDMVVAFPGGTGTEDMVSKALHAGIDTFAVDLIGEVLKMKLDDEGRAECPF